MAEHAIAAGSRILIAACVPSTIGPTRELLAGAAHAAGRTVQLDDKLMPEAWAFFQRGDRQGYWEAIAAGLRQAARGYDAVVLAQASMAGAAALLADLGIPVLASPRLGVEAAIAAYRAVAAAR
jgi:hypothetical protein